jgi:hypothetical protein
MIDDLNDDNFMIYAIKAYDKPNCLMSEFEEDINRIKYVKRLIKKYKMTGEMKERLILNHLIILANVFGVEHCVRMLFYKLDKEDYSVIKTFLLFLNYMPNIIKGIKGEIISSSDISIDLIVGRRLRDI